MPKVRWDNVEDNLGFKIGINFDFAKSDANLKKILGQLTKSNKLNLDINNSSTRLIQEELSLVNKMADARERAEIKKRNEIRKTEIAQSKAINKAIEENYKLQQQEELRIKKMGEVKGAGVNAESFTNKAYIENYIKSIYGLDTQIKKLQLTYDSAGNAQWKFSVAQEQSRNRILQSSGAIDQNTASLYQNNTQLREATSNQIGWAEGMKTAIIKSIQWGASMSLLYGNIRKIREGVSFIKEMDDSLTQVSMVTNKTTEETRRLAETYSHMGNDLKTSIEDLTTTAVSLYRQGLDDTKVEERLGVIAKTARATAVDIGLTTDFITAGVNASKMAAEDYSDVLIKAASIAGTSFDELGEGMSKVVSAASVSGISVQKLTSYLSTLSETTREAPSNLGNSMKTIIARFNQVNEETGELNEDFNRVQKAIESVGISFLDLNDQIRPVSDILDDLSLIWNSLDKNTQQYVSTQVAGVRQISRFQALMQNYNRSLEINNELMDASGTLNEQYSKYLKSAEASAQSAKVAFEQMWMNAMNSDTIKMFYDFSASIMNLVDKAGLLKTAIFALSAVIMLGSKSFMAWSASLATMNWVALISSIKAGTISIATFGAAIDVARIKVMAFQGVLTFGLALAISAIISGLVNWIASAQEAKRAQEELIETSFNTLKSTESEIGQLEILTDKYNKLVEQKQQGVDVDKELLEIQRQIASMSPELTTGIDNQGNAIADNIVLTENLIQKKKELLKEEMEVLQFEAKNRLPKIREDQRKAQERLDEINKQIADGGKKTITVDGFEYEIDIMKQLYDEKARIVSSQKEYAEEEAKLLGIVKKLIDEQQIEILATTESDEVKQRITKTIQELGLSLDDVNYLIEEFIAKQKESSSLPDFTPSIDTKTIEDYTKEFSEATSKLEEYQKILQETGSVEGLSAKTKQDIIEKHQQLLPYLNDEGELRRQLMKVIQTEEEVQRSSYFNMIKYTEEFLQAKVDGNKKLIDKLSEFYDIDLTNAKNLAEAKTIVERTMLDSLGKQWGRFMDVKTEAYTADYYMLESLAQMGDQQAINTLKSFDSAVRKAKQAGNEFQKVTLDLVSPDFSKINLSGAASSSSKTVMDKIFSALPYYNEQIKDTIDNLDNMRKEISYLENEIKVADSLNNTSKSIELQEQLINKRVEERDLLHQVANELRGLQSEISSDFRNKFNFNILDLSETDIKSFTDNIERQIVELQNKINKTTSDSIKNSLQSQINKLEQDKTLFNSLIDSYKQASSEIEKLGSDWFSSLINAESLKSSNLSKIITAMFDEISDALAPLNSELENLDYQLKLIDSDDVSGKTGLIAEKMNVLRQIIARATDELDRLNNTTPDNIKNTDEYKDKIKELEKTVRDSNIALKQFGDEIVSTNEKMANDLIKIIQDSYKKQLELIVNSLKEQLKAEEEAHNKRIEFLDDELSKREEVINAQIRNIDAQEDEDTYSKELAKMQEERAKIQSQIDLYSLDDSLEARNKVKELNEKLAQQNIAIKEFEHKRQIELRKQNLNDQLDAYKKEIEEKKNTENQKFDAIKEGIEKEIQMQEWKYDRLINDDAMYAQMREDIIAGNLDEVNDLLNSFLTDFENYNEKTIQNIGSSWQSLINQINEIKSMQDSLISDNPGSTGNYDNDYYKKDVSDDGFKFDSKGRVKMKRPLPNGTYVDTVVKDTETAIRMINEFGWKKYHNGGFVGDISAKTKHEEYAKLLKTEHVSTPKQLDNMIDRVLPGFVLKGINAVSGGAASSGLNIKSLLTVNGNLDRDILPQVQRMLDQAVNKIYITQKDNLNRLGITRGVNGAF